jgi:dinuclear metal center YbgI/SA1388 family protein
MQLQRLVAELSDLLEADTVSDYCPNGLQVEGRSEVRSIVTAVSASRKLFELAVDEGADAILVHHGILWNSAEPPRLVGSFRERVRILIENDISLIAYHLPLDRHLELGNAAGLARELGLAEVEPFGDHRGASVGVCGILSQPAHLDDLAEAVENACDRSLLVFPGDRDPIRSVGIVTGGGEKDYHRAVAAGLDAFITGEAGEWSLHQAAEDGVHFLSAGHYATERFGVQSLGRWITDRFRIPTRYIELTNPV